MKLFASLLLLSLSFNFGIAQSNLLCNLSFDSIPKDSEGNSSIQIMNNEEIYLFVENLMKSVDLPMNFQVRKCNSDRCRNNAFAAMTKNGTRYIKYDDAFFDKIRKESTKIGVLTVLAHEIGHHLSAHTLGLNHKNYEKALKFCKKSKDSYDKKKCDSLYQQDYKRYKSKQREKELEADRFSGYIMHIYGANLKQIKNCLINLHKGIEKDDRNSTHPKLSRRLMAVEEGYLLAEKYKDSKTKINIQAIKGYPKVEIELKQQDVEAMANLLLIYEIHDYIQFASAVLSKESKIEVQSGFKNAPKFELQDVEKARLFSKEVFADSKEYFGCERTSISSWIAPDIGYAVNSTIEIKNGNLKISVSTEINSKVVYSSKFDKDEISFEEITAIFAELLEDGFEKSIADYESKK